MLTDYQPNCVPSTPLSYEELEQFLCQRSSPLSLMSLDETQNREHIAPAHCVTCTCHQSNCATTLPQSAAISSQPYYPHATSNDTLTNHYPSPPVPQPLRPIDCTHHSIMSQSSSINMPLPSDPTPRQCITNTQRTQHRPSQPGTGNSSQPKRRTRQPTSTRHRQHSTGNSSQPKRRTRQPTSTRRGDFFLEFLKRHLMQGV
jgi:hypothetical protein